MNKTRDLKNTMVGFLLVSEKRGVKWLCICQKNGCGKKRVVSHYALVRKQVGQCRSCAKKAMLTMRRQATVSRLTRKTLTSDQEAVYVAIMLGREQTRENCNEALMEIQRATSLTDEAGWWIAGNTEPVHQQSGTGLLQEYASV